MRESECADRVMLSKGVCSLSSKTLWGKKQRLCTILKRCPNFSSSLLLLELGYQLMIGAPDSSPSNFELPSYMQMFEHSQVLECPWLSEVPIQGKRIQDGDVPKMCTVEQVSLC